jgi:hypothetical protein
MIRGLVILLFNILLCVPSLLAMSSSYEQGRVWAQSQSIPKPQNPNVVVGYGGTNLPQSQINASDLGSVAQSKAQSNEASKNLIETAGDRKTYVIDPQNDPLMIASNKAHEEARSATEKDITEAGSQENPSEEEISCEEGGEEYEQKCSKYLIIELKITPEKGHHNPKWCIGHWKSKVWGTKWYCGGCRGGEYVVDQAKKVEVIREQWEDGCALLESHVEQGLCRYVSATKSPKDETRTIQGEPIKRDHFEEHYQYACFQPSTKSCAGLRERGCYQTNSACKQKKGSQCVLWEQTYRCPKSKNSLGAYQSSNKNNPFCLTGDCADTSYEANSDLLSVMSQLSVLKEAQNDLRNFASIFKGQDRRCTRNCLDFRDCCGSGKGWGVSLKLASCDAEEKELRVLRDKNRCVMVGTYCAEKLLGQCIRKKTSFCCYSNKLAKIIQEQGRGQLGVGFGSPKNPQCQGLSADQLSRLDFSKINFSEVFQDIAAQTKVPNVQKLTQGIQQSMKDKTRHLTGPLKSSDQPGKVQGRGHGNF